MHTSYFIGVELPDSVTKVITRVQEEINPETSVIAPLQPHITVMHPDALSEVSPLYFEPITKEVASDYVPFEVTLHDFGIFNDSILYVAAESVALNALQAALVARLPERVQAEYFVGKNYKSHVTIAQVRGVKLSPEIIAAYKEKLAHLLPTTFEVEALTKYTRIAPRQYKTKTI
jgi:2'-5' RNA ligase